jgi:hypothetical protein
MAIGLLWKQKVHSIFLKAKDKILIFSNDTQRVSRGKKN